MRSQSQTGLSTEDTTEYDLVTKKKILPFTIWVDLEGIVVVVAVVQSLSHVRLFATP